MDSIKKFFEKKKKDAKFKLAGEGKQLSSTSRTRNVPRTRAARSKPVSRTGPTADSKLAGAAALARFETQGPKEINWSLQAIKAQAKREMEAEIREAELTLAEKSKENNRAVKTTLLEASPTLAVQGVYFHCMLLGPEIEKYNIIKGKIREFLYGQLEEDSAIASCLIIHTCNKKEKVIVCIDTLCKYIENIVKNPDDEKFRKIRKSNRAYQERIACIEGTKEFLESAGFVINELPFNESTEQFWIFPEDKVSDLSTLTNLRDALVSAEPLRPQLDRSLRVLLPKEAAKFSDIPPEFFVMSSDELKKEQQGRTHEVEQNQMLMTKIMREKLQLKELRKYRFTLIRIRFADGIILQGTFSIGEKFSAVLEFVRDSLTNSWRPFFLLLSGGGKMIEEESSLLELRLVPAVVFNFEWDLSIQDPDLDDRIYLTDDIMMLLQECTIED